jgi:hypothetical protein
MGINIYGDTKNTMPIIIRRGIKTMKDAQKDLYLDSWKKFIIEEPILIDYPPILEKPKLPKVRKIRLRR